MTTKNHDSAAIVRHEPDSIWVHVGNALVWNIKTTNEYSLSLHEPGVSIKLTPEDLTDIAQAITAMTKEKDGDL